MAEAVIEISGRGARTMAEPMGNEVPSLSLLPRNDTDRSELLGAQTESVAP